ncbi:unnamed protein product [Symbiodinium sp. CCMP2592]|nr:unnamed protein product [Symbiodinium sp. CCMP2592]
MGMLRNAARSAKLVLGGATAGLVAGTAGTVHLAQGGGGQSWWAKQFKLQFFQPFLTQNSSSASASDETSLRDLQVLYQQKMTALELVAEMQREEIAELLDAKTLKGPATMPPNSTETAESPALEKKRADLADEKLGHLYNELNELQGLRAAEEKAREELQGQLARKVADMMQLQQELDERKQELERAKKLSSDDIAALQKTIQSQQLENNKLGQRYGELKKSEAKKEQTITELQQLRISEERSRTELRGQLKQKDSELSQLQKALEKASKETEEATRAKSQAVASMEAKLNAQKIEHEKLGTKYSELQAAGKKQEERIAELDGLCSLEQKGREELRGQLTEKASQMAQLQKDLDKAAQQMEQMEKSKSDAVAAMEETLNAQRVEHDKLGQMHTALKSEDAKKDAQIAELQSLYASEQKGREEMQGQLEQKAQDLGRVSQGLEIAMRDMSAFRASKAEEIRSLAEAMKQKEALLSEAQGDLEKLRAREQEASTQLHKLQQWKDECEKIKERFLREKLSHIKIDL